MNHFLYKLIPPRSTFPGDMSETEGAIMQAHFGYWVELMEKRKAVAYGPVLDPTGTYGIAVVEVSDEATARGIATDDPAIRSRAGFSYELYPMADSIVRP